MTEHHPVDVASNDVLRDQSPRPKLPSPSLLMWLLFGGFLGSFVYGMAAYGIIDAMDGKTDARKFLMMYIGPFNTLVTFGLIASTALIVGASQNVIPNAIETTFRNGELSSTPYLENKGKYFSFRRTIVFASQMIVLSFAIFYYCHFPLSGLAEAFMMIAVCAQWGLASYVGRKLRYAGMMLYSILEVKVNRNLFKERELDIINTCVHIASTLTIVWVYLHVRSYYVAEFEYDRFFGSSAQVFLLLPALLAVPVLLIFNFYPREVLHKVYDKSIEIEVNSLQEELKSEALSPLEEKLRFMELSKMYREELRYRLQLTLSDLPIGIALIGMVVEPFIKG